MEPRQPKQRSANIRQVADNDEGIPTFKPGRPKGARSADQDVPVSDGIHERFVTNDGSRGVGGGLARLPLGDKLSKTDVLLKGRKIPVHEFRSHLGKSLAREVM